MRRKLIFAILITVIISLSLIACQPDTPQHPEAPEDQNNLWLDSTQLIFQINENSNSTELPSTSRRYLAGNLDGVDDISLIDQWVADRNSQALQNANVDVIYRYLPDTSGYGWAMNIYTIDAEVKSKEPGRPDIYCNFVYDMVAISLKGSFANLLSTTMYADGHELDGINHFDFAKNPDMTDTGTSYMMDYMRSLTLSKNKMYCLASDYFIDLMRAALVIPVNISLLETLRTTGIYDSALAKGDFLANRVTTYNEDGNEELQYTIEDLYQLVYDMEWNYDNLAKFSGAIFSEGDEGDDSVDLRDTVGFAVGTGSGISARGLLHSSSVTIIDRVYDPIKGDYTHSYPNVVQEGEGDSVSFVNGEGTHDELIAFCDNLSALFNQNGIITVKPGVTYGYGDTDLKAIRARFASGNILFGGIVTLGSLEYDEYKDMNEQGASGYGIVPVPLYRTNYTDADTGETMVDNYLTQIYNIGKIGAISYTTEKFAECTAYLNYQSTHSTDILNEYFDHKHQHDVTDDGVKGNVEMLKYIRYNVRSCLDITFDDVIRSYFYLIENMYDVEDHCPQWYVFIKNNNYRIDSMERYYNAYAPMKAWRIYNIENTVYPTLPD